MQKLSKALAALLGLSLLLLGWATFELMRAKDYSNIAMQQAEMANQRIDSIVEKMYAGEEAQAQS